jgi:glutamate 5-kinase
LAAGIKKVSGKFNKGDHIKIIDIKNNEFARGLSSFSSEEIVKIIGCIQMKYKKYLAMYQNLK